MGAPIPSNVRCQSHESAINFFEHERFKATNGIKGFKEQKDYLNAQSLQRLGVAVISAAIAWGGIQLGKTGIDARDHRAADLAKVPAFQQKAREYCEAQALPVVVAAVRKQNPEQQQITLNMADVTKTAAPCLSPRLERMSREEANISIPELGMISAGAISAILGSVLGVGFGIAAMSGWKGAYRNGKIAKGYERKTESLDKIITELKKETAHVSASAPGMT